MPSPIIACRYHSLSVVESSLPDTLVADAWTEAGEVMSLRHREHPTFGLQFHPESFRSPTGTSMLERFLERAR